MLEGRWLARPHVINEGFNPHAALPYGLGIADVKFAIDENLYGVLHALNLALVGKIDMRLEELMRLNSFPDLLSEILARGLAARSRSLTRNKKHDGFPDLIPRGKYPDDQVHRGEGVEVKASKQKSGWQGHNPEAGWLMVFRYDADRESQPKENRNPTEIVEVMAAELALQDWTFSGRDETSRRTITASVNQSGVRKMRSNMIYRKDSPFL